MENKLLKSSNSFRRLYSYETFLTFKLLLDISRKKIVFKVSFCVLLKATELSQKECLSPSLRRRDEYNVLQFKSAIITMKFAYKMYFCPLV